MLKNLVNKAHDFGTMVTALWQASLMPGCYDSEEWLNTHVTALSGFSYVEDIMGPLCFDFGYDPSVGCLSHKEEDLKKTDLAASELIDPKRNAMDRDNHHWIVTAEQNRLVVGTLARILYADEEGRIRLALKFNDMVRKGEIGAVMLDVIIMMYPGQIHHSEKRLISTMVQTRWQKWQLNALCR